MFASRVEQGVEIVSIHTHWDQNHIVHYSDFDDFFGKASRHRDERVGHHRRLVGTGRIIGLEPRSLVTQHRQGKAVSISRLCIANFSLRLLELCLAQLNDRTQPQLVTSLR